MSRPAPEWRCAISSSHGVPAARHLGGGAGDEGRAPGGAAAVGRDRRDGRAELRARAAGGDPRSHARARAGRVGRAGRAAAGRRRRDLHARDRASWAIGCPGWRAASRTVGSPQIRNRGTIGGNLGSSSPAGDALPPLYASDAEVELASAARGARRLPIGEFVTGVKQNALAPDELIAAFHVAPAEGPQQFSKIGTRNAMVIAVCSFSLALHPSARRVGTCIGSAAPTPVRADEAERFAEQELDWDGRGPIAEPALERFGELVAAAASPIDDVRGSAAYRRHALSVLARRSLAWAWREQMRLTCTINGAPREVDGLWEGESLLHVLRERLELPGSKNACEQGECGSCSVYLDDELVCSCLVLAGQAEGREIVTVEGLTLRRGRAAPGAGGVPRGRRRAVRLLHARADRGHPRPARAQPAPRATPRSARRWPATSAAARATRRSSTRCASPRSGRCDDPPRARELRAGDRRCGRHRARRRARRHPPRLHRRGRPRPGARAGRRRGGGPHRRQRLPRHPRPRQLPPPPLPVGDPRAGAGGDALRVAPGALPRVGARRRGDRARRRARRAGRAAALRLHDGERPPLRLPARGGRPAGGRDRRRSRAGRALPPVPRLDGPRPLGGRPAARRGGRGPRRDPGRVRAGARPLPRPGAGRDGADRARAVLAVLGHARADGRERRAGAAPRRAAAHAPGRDRRRGALLPGAVRRAPGRVPRAARLAGRRRVARPLRAPRHDRGAPLRRDRHRRRPLPELERPPRCGHRARRRARDRGRAGRARGRRRRLQRGRRARRGAAPGAAARAAGGRPAGADGPGGAGAGHDPRRALPGARGRDRLAGAGQAGRHRAVAARRPRPRRHRRSRGRAGARAAPAGGAAAGRRAAGDRRRRAAHGRRGRAGARARSRDAGGWRIAREWRYERGARHDAGRRRRHEHPPP